MFKLYNADFLHKDSARQISRQAMSSYQWTGSISGYAIARCSLLSYPVYIASLLKVSIFLPASPCLSAVMELHSFVTPLAATLSSLNL